MPVAVSAMTGTYVDYAVIRDEKSSTADRLLVWFVATEPNN